MRMSCNGCRVLRKGCSENCSIRPCLQWIKSPEAQANATVFLAKFYGRAGLMNLINAGPENLRPAVFRSLLYEACGRIVNPIYGSVGLLWSGSWQLCQAAVEAVLKGSPITPMASDTALTGHAPPLKAYDIRHVSKDHENVADINQGFRDNNSKSRRKRSAEKLEKGSSAATAEKHEMIMTRSASHESSLSHQSELAVADNSTESGKETTESCSMASGEETGVNHEAAEEVGLELTLGIAGPLSRERHVVPVKKRRAVGGYGTCEEDVMLGLRCEIEGKN